ncbi:hypothetical protein [Saccharopolyspora taberi]|uniref:Sulfotransferase family protein n=1 Tax=Saccharopolyspora taberi TaxID=60895 RepID=A0ABN3VEY8_9PSEU
MLEQMVERGALPVAVDTDRDVLVLSPLAEARFDEPSFDGTARAGADGRLYRWTLDDFVDQVAKYRPTQPLRLIAHTSRCGSTLLANLLGLRPHHMVLKEPGFLVHSSQRALRRGPSREDVLLRALLHYCRAVADAHHRSLVVKLTSWTAPLILRALEGSPDVRWLFQWRDPAAVVASQLASSPRWWTHEDIRSDVARLLAHQDETDPARFYALVWCAITNAALSTPMPSLRYEDLVSDKLRALLAAEEWLSLGVAQAAPDGFEERKSQYSKGSSSQRFDPVGAHRRPQLEEHQATAVQSLSGELLSALQNTAVPLLGPAKARP